MKFSKDDIIKSVEYQWRKHQIKMYFNIWLLVSLISIVVIPVVLLITNKNFVFVAILAWLGYAVFCFLIFGSFMLFSYNKMKYLIKNYENMQVYEVKLDTISTSYMYRGSAYYTVTIDSRKVDTNPLFSNLFFSKYTLEDYNNKTVVGLFDDSLNKFYVIKKVC